jgi:hypothetical protein
MRPDPRLQRTPSAAPPSPPSQEAFRSTSFVAAHFTSAEADGGLTCACSGLTHRLRLFARRGRPVPETDQGR